jgi:hypothetical protein
MRAWTSRYQVLQAKDTPGTPVNRETMAAVQGIIENRSMLWRHRAANPDQGTNRIMLSCRASGR